MGQVRRARASARGLHAAMPAQAHNVRLRAETTSRAQPPSHVYAAARARPILAFRSRGREAVPACRADVCQTGGLCPLPVVCGKAVVTGD